VRKFTVVHVWCTDRISLLLHKNSGVISQNSIKDPLLRIEGGWSAGGQVWMDDEAGRSTMITTIGTKVCGGHAVQ
jgi:hypothetical protein